MIKQSIKRSYEGDINGGSDIAHRTKEEAEKVAESMGLVAFFPNPRELFLDLDAGMEFKHRVVNYMLHSLYDIESRLTTTSQHGNRHMYLLLSRQMDGVLKPAVQSALGSDPIKEMLTALRMQEGTKPEAAICLFETMEEGLKVEEWRSSNDQPV